MINAGDGGIYVLGGHYLDLALPLAGGRNESEGRSALMVPVIIRKSHVGVNRRTILRATSALKPCLIFLFG